MVGGAAAASSMLATEVIRPVPPTELVRRRESVSGTDGNSLTSNQGSFSLPPGINMKLKTYRLLAVFAASAVVSARATLIGDSIDIARYYPNSSTVFKSFPGVIVQAGSGDAVDFSGAVRVNPEAGGVEIRFLDAGSFTPALSNSIVISGIDDTLLGVSVNTNLTGWDGSRLSFDAHSVTSEFEGLSFTVDSFFDVFFEIQIDGNPIPDEAATATLLAMALIAITTARRVRQA